MEIRYKDKVLEVEKGSKIYDIFKNEIENSENTVVGAIYNNTYVNLSRHMNFEGRVELISINSKIGIKIYRRTLIYIFAMALKKLFPDNRATVNYQMENAVYCDLGDIEVTDEIVAKINEEMRDIVRKNLFIKKVVMNREQAEQFYKETQTARGKLQYDLKSNKKIYMYYCEDYFNYCYGVLARTTGAIKIFDIIKYDNGILLRYPSAGKPDQLPKIIQNKKMKWAYNEYNEIHKILNINTVYKLNDAVKEKRIKDVIMIDEALHEKNIANIADKIAKDKKIKMILIAGPSSSGKTTFAQRVEMPQFDFLEGTKKYNGKYLQLKDDEVLVIEGIHCLNDRLTSSIPQEQKFKIYISALTVLNMDRYSKVSSTDVRLIRRIVRDYQFRGYSAEHTIDTWPSVTRGEVENIFPFQESADVIFNTSLIYELGVLKGIATPLLKEIPIEHPEHAEAQRLLGLLKYIRSIPASEVPTNSLLKEFVGGGDFEY